VFASVRESRKIKSVCTRFHNEVGKRLKHMSAEAKVNSRQLLSVNF